ncbi:MAG TPA: YeeE/YedE family protein [Methylibium sp.]|uniref:YeeE/YedE family protein n=1 Tax=Methylibium sp. TaxID=2067992 RepID=UPI002DB65C46|nr:YeeE/YedE family protein [Methylibium sp.]HEU4459563.1 YeeE/YedE family protein [Methylibium sp.]
MAAPDTLLTLVLLGGAALGLAFGALVQATRFCTMGAIADVMTFGDATRLRMWVGAALVAMLGAQALIGFGGVDLSSSIYTSRRIPWLSQALGGALFGFGMVLAGGCPSRALTRLGSGNLKALVVLLMVGLFAQMSLRGVLAAPRANGLDSVALMLAGPQDLPGTVARLSGFGIDVVRVALCAAIALPVLAWIARGAGGRRPAAWLASLAIGAIVAGAWWLTGALGHLAEHPETLEPAWLGTASKRPEALSFVAPSAHALDLLTLWSDRGTVLSFGVALLVGTTCGAALSALARREFHWESFRDLRDLAQHLVGGALMGAGGVLALGCSIGQGLSGVSLLSIGSFVALAAIVLGACAALRYQAGVIERCG